MSGVSVVLGAGVLAALAAIAVSDAKRMTIPLRWLAVFLASGMGWLAMGGLAAAGGGWEWHAAGAAAGVGMPFAFILRAQALGRRWPIYPGDAWLLGAAGAVLGVRALFWAMATGSALALAHRACLQRKRGRPYAAGYLPAGPGLAAGTAAVFVALNAGIALGDVRAKAGADGAARIEAIELLPVKTGLPDALAGKEVAIEALSPMPLPEILGRIGRAAGVEIGIEERPSRLPGGRAELAAAPALAAGTETRLDRLLDDVAARAGYAWEWKEDRVVFYRYWDTSWPRVGAGAPEAPDGKPVADEGDEAPGGVLAWLGRVFGGGGRDREPGPPEAAEAAETAKAEPAAGEGADSFRQSGEKKDDPAGAAPDADPEPAPAEAAGVAWAPAPEPLVWEVDPEGQGTLRGVLEAWAERAEWKIAWRAERDFRVGAAARFGGGFLEAVDGLLSDPGVSRVLTARAYANRYLVVHEAGR